VNTMSVKRVQMFAANIGCEIFNLCEYKSFLESVKLMRLIRSSITKRVTLHGKSCVTWKDSEYMIGLETVQEASLKSSIVRKMSNTSLP
jgi:hypothetical protein